MSLAEEMYLYPANLKIPIFITVTHRVPLFTNIIRQRFVKYFARRTKSEICFSRSKAVKYIRNVDNSCHQVLPLELTKNFEEEKQVFFSFSFAVSLVNLKFF